MGELIGSGTPNIQSVMNKQCSASFLMAPADPGCLPSKGAAAPVSPLHPAEFPPWSSSRTQPAANWTPRPEGTGVGEWGPML